jgi:hypothetical protein
MLLERRLQSATTTSIPRKSWLKGTHDLLWSARRFPGGDEMRDIDYLQCLPARCTIKLLLRKQDQDDRIASQEPNEN